jgi:5'-3' exonuclease
VEIIFVFDGRPRKEKKSTIVRRKNNREKQIDKIGKIIEHTTNPEEDFKTIMQIAKQVQTITHEHITVCKELFDLLGIAYIHLEDVEADCIFKFLLDHGIADACYSGDMDLLAYGCQHVILDLNFGEDTAIEIDYNQLLAYLAISQQQLLMAFILSGTEYNSGLKKTNFAMNLDLIKKYGDIPAILANLDEINKDLSKDKEIGRPNKFDWEFTQDVYLETLAPEAISKIKNQLVEKAKLKESITTTDSSIDNIQKYGVIVLKDDLDCKYIKKLQEYLFWKYSYRLNLIPYKSAKPKSRPNTDSPQIQKKIKS